jgi:hypothetical protein
MPMKRQAETTTELDLDEVCLQLRVLAMGAWLELHRRPHRPRPVDREVLRIRLLQAVEDGIRAASEILRALGVMRR